MPDPVVRPLEAAPATSARPRTVSAVFQAALRIAPTGTFLAMDAATLRYAQAADGSRAVATGLAARGIGRGDRVAIVAANRPEMVVLWLACLRLGACFCPLNTGFTGPQLANLFRRMSPALVVSEPGTAAAVADGLGRSEAAGRRPVALEPAPDG